MKKKYLNALSLRNIEDANTIACTYSSINNIIMQWINNINLHCRF